MKVAWLICFLLMSFSSLLSQTATGHLPVRATDNRTHSPLCDVSFCLERLDRCVRTDSSGTALFDTLTPGLYTVLTTAPGYDTLVSYNIQITSGLNRELVVALTRSADMQDLDKLVVVGRKLASKKPEQSTSVTRLDNFELSNTAGTANDINRVLAVLPSTVSGLGEGFDNNLYVRGGSSRENIFIVDGIRFENASHFSSVDNSGGAVGFINGALVQKLDFYAGGFPAKMPSRLSSVIDLSLRNGSFTERKQQIDLNMSGLGLTTEGPLFNGAASYLLSMRLVDLRFLESLLSYGGIPSFGDLQTKIVFTPDDRQTITLTGIGAFDHFNEHPEMWTFTDTLVEVKYDEFLKQGGGGINWEYISDKFRNNLHFSGTARTEECYDQFTDFNGIFTPDTYVVNISQYNRDSTVTDSLVDPSDTLYFGIDNYVKPKIWNQLDKRWQINLFDDFTFYLSDHHQINTGLFGEYEHFYIANGSGERYKSFCVHFPDGSSPVVLPGLYENDTKSYLVDSALAVKSGGAYAEYIYDNGPFKAIAGVRGDYYTVITDYGISPRLGLSFEAETFGTFSASGGLYYQFPADFSGLLTDIIASSPNWNTSKVPLDKARLQRCWQGVLGYERQIGDTHLLSAETWLKWYDREYPLSRPGSRRYGEWKDGRYQWLLDDPNGKKRGYGFELSFQKKKYDHLYYSLNYSLFNVENRYTDKKWYIDDYCVGNAVGMTIGSNFKKHHGLSFRLQFSQGKPYTDTLFNATTNTYSYDTTKVWNSERMENIFSLNFRYSFKVFQKWGNITGYVEIWNMLNNTPVVEMYLNERQGFETFEANGILPFLGLMVDF